jgi:hypothetical protein
MEIIADFYSDFIKINLEIINELKSQGFQFEEYQDWKKRKDETIGNIHSSKKTYTQETDLINAYNKDLVFAFSNFLEKYLNLFLEKFINVEFLLALNNIKQV